MHGKSIEVQPFISQCVVHNIHIGNSQYLQERLPSRWHWHDLSTCTTVTFRFISKWGGVTAGTAVTAVTGDFGDATMDEFTVVVDDDFDLLSIATYKF